MLLLDVKSISLGGLCLLLALCSAAESHAAEVKVFLMGGQSNALGRAPSSGLPANLQVPQDDVLFFYDSPTNSGPGLTTLRPGSGKFTSEFGPEVTFGRTVADASPSVDYAIIKYAWGGTTLYNHWAPGTGSAYTAFRNTVAAGLEALEDAGHTTEIAGMVWHQGESDAINGQQDNYASNLTAFIADIRSRYGANLPFLIGEIRRSNGPAFVTVADAQIAVANADPLASFVPASDLTFLDTYHFDAAGQQTLGERFAAAYAALMDPSGDSTPPTLAGSNIVDDRGGAAVTPGTTVTYAVTFSEDIDAATVSAADFDNAGSAAISMGNISETSPGVFSVTLTPTSEGTLQLRVPVGANIADPAGNLLDSATAITDDTIISVTGSIHAAIIVPTGVTAPSEFNTGRRDDYMIDGSGFDSVNLTHINLTTATQWTSAYLSIISGSDTKDTFATQSVVFDLGANYDLTEVFYWNYNVNNANTTAGAQDVELFVASSAGGAKTSLGNYVFAKADGTATYAGGSIDIDGLTATDDVREVTFSITSNHGFSNASGALVGLAEVRFQGTAINDFAKYISDPAFGLAPADQGFDLDPDGDNIPNGVEAWFGTHPGGFNAGLVLASTDGATTTTFTHPQNEASPSDVSGFYEWSPNLNDWYASGSGPAGGPTVSFVPNTVGTTTTVTATASETLDKLFLRVGVMQLP